VNPDNPFILVSHLKCAAFELPVGDSERFGDLDVRRFLAALEDEAYCTTPGATGTGRPRPIRPTTRRCAPSPPTTSSSSTPRRATRSKRSGARSSPRSTGERVRHDLSKAIYLVESEPFEVQELHFREDEEKVAYVKHVAVDYFTDAISAKASGSSSA